jgi:hypothetical protein
MAIIVLNATILAGRAGSFNAIAAMAVAAPEEITVALAIPEAETTVAAEIIALPVAITGIISLAAAAIKNVFSEAV